MYQIVKREKERENVVMRKENWHFAILFQLKINFLHKSCGSSFYEKLL